MFMLVSECAGGDAQFGQAAVAVHPVRSPAHRALPAIPPRCLIIFREHVARGAPGWTLADDDRFIGIEPISSGGQVKGVVPGPAHPVIVMRRIEIEPGPDVSVGFGPQRLVAYHVGAGRASGVFRAHAHAGGDQYVAVRVNGDRSPGEISLNPIPRNLAAPGVLVDPIRLVT